MSEHSPIKEELPIIIIGAGISGLLLAQRLRRHNLRFRIFERDEDFLTRGIGWGLTLHWSLPALRALLPEDLLTHLSDTYVDRAAVERGESSTFPFFDLSTGVLKGSSPKASVDQRVRVTRERLRRLLAREVNIEWGKAFTGFREDEDSIHVIFEDQSTSEGRLIVGCDGSHSRVRRALFPDDHVNHTIPVRMFGFTLRVNAEQAAPIREIDPFFLQGTASASNIFMYISLLEAPQASCDSNDGYLYQVCVSWNTNNTSIASKENISEVTGQEDRVAIVRNIAQNLAEPFRSFLQLIPPEANVKRLNLDDFIPRAGNHPGGRLILLGDASHAMTMYRGEGANHAIVDVLELEEKVLHRSAHSEGSIPLAALQDFEEGVVARTHPAVLASRQACIDAHDWSGLTPKSPLLTKRQMHLELGA